MSEQTYDIPTIGMDLTNLTECVINEVNSSSDIHGLRANIKDNILEFCADSMGDEVYKHYEDFLDSIEAFVIKDLYIAQKKLEVACNIYPTVLIIFDECKWKIVHMSMVPDDKFHAYFELSKDVNLLEIWKDAKTQILDKVQVSWKDRLR